MFKIIFFNETVFTQFKCWMCMTIRHSYRFQPLQIGLAYLSPKTRCVLCAFNTLIHLTIRYLYEILSLKNGLTKLFYFEPTTCKGKSTNKFDNTIIYYDFLREDLSPYQYHTRVICLLYIPLHLNKAFTCFRSVCTTMNIKNL